MQAEIITLMSVNNVSPSGKKVNRQFPEGINAHTSSQSGKNFANATDMLLFCFSLLLEFPITRRSCPRVKAQP